MLTSSSMLQHLLTRLRDLTFPGSDAYWDRRYRSGGNSGPGSYGRVARFKAEVLNAFVEKHAIGSVLELGCGDGHQLSLARYPRYIGLDVSRAAIERCATTFRDDPSKSFFLYDPQAFVDRGHIFSADLALSLDVLYHLVEDDVYDLYLRHLFAAANRYVVLFTNPDDLSLGRTAPHIKLRPTLRTVAARQPDFRWVEEIPSPWTFGAGAADTWSNFYVFERWRSSR